MTTVWQCKKRGLRKRRFGLGARPAPAQQRAAFTLVEIMLCLSIVGLLATIGLPYYIHASASSRRSACISNLRHLDDAAQQFILETRKAACSKLTLDDCTPYLKRSLVCPTGGTTVFDSYSVTDGQTIPTCIAVGGGAPNGHIMAQ